MNRQLARKCLVIVLGVSVIVTTSRLGFAIIASKQGWALLEMGSLDEAFPQFEKALWLELSFIEAPAVVLIFAGLPESISQ